MPKGPGYKYTPKDIDVVVLCGGLGTRLRDIVNDRPKVMAEVSGRPFLDILLDYISEHGFKRFILCVGYKKEMIKQHYSNLSDDLAIMFSEEKELLGTAGAIKNAEIMIKSKTFLVINGDSFCRINLKEFLAFHKGKGAYASIALVSPEKEADYGVVKIDRDHRILHFSEKVKSLSDSYINAGIYFFQRSILDDIPLDKVYSLETDLFPRIIGKGIYGYVAKEKLIDIGTPERFKKAEGFLIEVKKNE